MERHLPLGCDYNNERMIMASETAWETELAEFLAELSEVQQQSLQLLEKKRQLLAAWDTEGLAALAEQEESLIDRLRQCQQRREAMLQRAEQEGLQANNVRTLASSLPRNSVSHSQRGELIRQTHRVAGQARLLQHQSLINWVLVQRALIHLSQVLEIIATGGQMQPTYGKGPSGGTGGALLDRVA